MIKDTSIRSFAKLLQCNQGVFIGTWYNLDNLSNDDGWRVCTSLSSVSKATYLLTSQSVSRCTPSNRLATSYQNDECFANSEYIDSNVAESHTLSKIRALFQRSLVIFSPGWNFCQEISVREVNWSVLTTSFQEFVIVVCWSFTLTLTHIRRTVCTTKRASMLSYSRCVRLCHLHPSNLTRGSLQNGGLGWYCDCLRILCSKGDCHVAGLSCNVVSMFHCRLWFDSSASSVVRPGLTSQQL